MLTGDIHRHSRAVHDRLLGKSREVVAVERDVQLSAGHLRALGLFNELLQTARDVDAAPVDTHQYHVVGTLVVLHHLVGDAANDAIKILRVHQFRLFSKFRHQKPLLRFYFVNPYFRKKQDRPQRNSLS